MPAFPQVYVLLVGLARCVWVAVIVESNNVEVSNRRSDLVPSARAARARARKTKSRAKRQRGEKEDDRLGERKKRRRCDGVGRRLRLRARRITSVRVPGTLPKPIAVAVRRGGRDAHGPRETVSACRPLPPYLRSSGDSRTRLSINQPESSGRCLPRSMCSSRLFASRQTGRFVCNF